MKTFSSIRTGLRALLVVAVALMAVAVAASPASAQSFAGNRVRVEIAPLGDVVVYWYNTPGNDDDWVTVIGAGRPDSEYGPWTYTNGQASGSFTADRLSPGQYEARLYYDWSANGYRVVERVFFEVQ